MEHVHQDKDRQNTHGHGDGDGSGGPEPAQEEEHHHGGQHHAHLDVLHGGVHRHVDVVGGGIQHGVYHRAVPGLEAGHGLHHSVGGGHLVGPGLLGHLEHHAGRAVGLGHRVRLLRLQPYVGHLRQADGPPGGQGEDHAGHILHRLKLGVGGDGEGLGAVLEVAAGVEKVFRRQHLGDVGVGQPQTGGPGGVHLHRHLLGDAAGDGYLGHPVDALQGGGHRILGQRLDRDQVVPLEGNQSGGHQVADVDVDDNGVGGPVRQGDAVKLLPQLGGGDVQIGPLHIGDLDLGHAVGRGGLHSLHPGHRHNGRLQRPGDQLLHIGGSGPVIVAHDQSGGGLHVWQKGKLELGGKDHAENGDHNDRHQGGHLVLDTEFGDIVHRPQSSPDTIRTGSPSVR